MPHRLLALVAVAAAALFPVADSAAISAPKLSGTVGPGFTIALKDGTGQRVAKLRAGNYTFVVRDRSPAHSFMVEKAGGTFEKEITGIGFVGTKSRTIALTKGKWKVYCAPHESTMHHSFTVT